MMRALWTAASGMTTQQTNVDTISNNLSNINTTGFKKEAAQFKTLLYQTIQNTQTDRDGNDKPMGAQVGLGVRTSAVRSIFTQGAPTETGNDYDFYIDGDGFFAVTLPNGGTGYTRNGSFQLAIGENGLTLATTDGNPVLDSNGQQIVIDPKYTAADITVDSNGYLCYPDANNNQQSIGVQIGLVQFANPGGLLKSSDSILLQTNASGEPVFESSGTAITKSKIRQGYLEASNVESIEEMVNLIVAQRAYEMNSKIISASDQMLQQANNLRG